MQSTGTAGSALRALRESQGLSLRRLAELSGTSASYLGEIERDEKVPTSRVQASIISALAENLRRVSA